jgi:hypothetical protein
MDQTSVTVANQNRIPLAEIERMALAFAKSGLFGIKNPEQGIALMLIAQAEGMHPAIAARDFHIVDGKPTLKADALLARFQQAGGKVSWGEYTDKEVTATFSHPQGGSVTVSWTIAQAESIGLARKSVWKQYPRAMLRSRVISEGIRTVYPGVSIGVYTPEEIQDINAKPETKEVQSTPVSGSGETSSVQVQNNPIKHESVLQTSAIIQPESLPSFDRKGAFKKLASSGWSKEDLAHYAWSQWGKESAKDLTDTQLTEFLAVVCKPYSEVIASDGDSLL